MFFRSYRRIFHPDLLVIFLLLLLPFVFFWPVTFGGRVLVPFDNLYTIPPWRSVAGELGVGQPHNGLLSDLVLENYVWKNFIVEALKARQIPLWNPYLFAGVPFLAAGQHSALYPLSILFYVLPVPRAYGYFTALQLFLAGLFTYVYLRLLRAGRPAALLAGITFMFSLLVIANVVFPMIVAALSWLPALLAVIEALAQQARKAPAPLRACLKTRGVTVRSNDFSRFLPASACNRRLKPVVSEAEPSSLRALFRQALREGSGGREGGLAASIRALPLLVLGSLVVGLQFLAGHIEISYYVLLVAGFYSLWRLANVWHAGTPLRRVLQLGGGLAAMVFIGVALAAVQLIPLYELASVNFRQSSASYAQVIGWSFPWRQLISFILPDFYGNPVHHGYFDVVTRAWRPASQDFAGRPIDTIVWGTKNYVEAASYVGVLPLLLALLAALQRLTGATRSSGGTASRPVWLFVALAGISLAFAFGTPLYAVLYNALPGFSQLHTPFRWVFPYVFSVAVLAGLGADGLWRQGAVGDRPQREECGASELPGAITLVAGLGGLLVLAISFLSPDPFVRLADRVLGALGTAQVAFADGRMFFSYQFRNLLLFGLFLAASGLVLLASRWPPRPAQPGSTGRQWLRWAPALAVALVLTNLWVIGHNFNPATDPALAEYTPPAVQFLQAQEKPFRVTTFGDDQTLLPNTLMPYGIEDVRGYDSIIPKPYVDLVSRIDDQRWLLYNRVGPLTSPAGLDSPLLDLLNVRYVVTQGTIEQEGFTLVYDDQVLRIYRNEDALPRAYVVPQAQRIQAPSELLPALEHTDLRSVVLLEDVLPVDAAAHQSPAAIPNSQFPQIIHYTLNEVVIDVALQQPAWLVLGDSFFPGWRAYVTTNGGQEQETQVYRANYNFRAIFLSEGGHRVRFKYSPMSFKVGLYASFLAGIVLLLGGGFWLWGRIYREEEGSPAQRVAKNSLLPMATSLLNKVIDFAFAMLMLRVLGPVLAGRYYFAIVVVGFIEIFTNFGLNLLLTREVARDRSQANRYLSNSALLRLILWGISLPLLLAFLMFRQALSPLTPDTIWAIGLLMLALIPGNIAAALSSLFIAHERMEVPAAIATLSTLLKVSLGALALLLGYGFIGLASVSVIVSTATAVVFYWIASRAFFRPRLEFDRVFNWQMVLISYPLMLNHLLQTLFFKVDVVLLQSLKGDAVVGWYSTAYKWIDALLIIPAYFTMAIFPLMSRYAVSARASLVSAHILALRLLTIVAIPIAVLTTFVADDLITVLGGSEYLPHGAIALQLMIWFLPFSFINGVSQYVLIAIDQQRWITRSFVIVATFNVAANLAFIPSYGYRAAAVITILSEFVLFIPFYRRIRENLGPLPWALILGRPLAAGGGMMVLMWALRGISPLLTLPLSGAVYLAGLHLLGTFTDDDRALVRRIWPGRPRAAGMTLTPDR